MKINPVYRKEVRMMWRSPRFILSVIGMNLALGLVALSFIAFMKDTIEWWNPVLEWMFCGNGISQMSSEISYNSIRALYTLLAVMEFIFLLVLLPPMTAGAISGERERQTLELLLTTPLSPSKIVIGKLCATINIIFTMLFSTLPIFALMYVFGGLGLQKLLDLLGVLLVLMIYLGSIGIFCSTICSKTIRARMITTVIVLAVTVLPILAVQWMDRVIDVQGLRLGGAIFCMGLLLDPALSFISLLQYQLGGSESFLYYLEEICHVSKDTFLADNWLLFSLIAQMLCACLLVYGAGHLLLPKYRREDSGFF